jgi:hypothetical protein
VFANIRLGSLVLLSAESTEQYGIQISDAQLTPPAAARTLKLDFLLSNQGNSHIFPEAKLAILDSRRRLAGKAEAEVRRFFPLQKDRLSVSYAGELPPGNYTAILTVSYGPDMIDTAEFPFSVDAQ